MPYTVVDRGARAGAKRYCVYKKGASGPTGESLGCHPSPKKAGAQIGAIEASEAKKELPMTDDAEVKVKMYEGEVEMTSYIPLGATSFADVDEYIVSMEAAERVKELTRQFQTLAGNILYDEAVTDKGAALNALVSELDTRLGEAVKAKGLFGAVKEAILNRLVGIHPEAKEKMTQDFMADREAQRPSAGLMLWKEGEQYRWLAIYSNKYMDKDSPPEIISEAAHREFITAVENKEAPYPELWHFHVPGTRWGQADMLAYDDAGFVIASGTVDKGKEAEAEALSARSDIRVSHGMWRNSVRYDPKDKSVITRYRSVEISDLPLERAANPLTGFYTMKEGDDMGLPKDKREYLKSVGVSDERIAEIERELEGKAQAAKEAGLASKEGEAPAPETPKAPETEPKAVETLTPQGEQPKAEPTPTPLTVESIASAVTAAIEPFVARLSAVEAAQSKEKAKDEERIAKAAADTPAASIAALVMRNLTVRGQESAKAPDDFKPHTPTEAKEGTVKTGIPWLDKVISEPPKK